MEKIKTIIIDDDIFIHAQLREQLMLLFPKVQVVAVCENALHGIEAIKSHRPDLIFLDIQMPGLSGFEMLDHVDRNNLKVIFITSYNQYAIEAIRYSAFDYLLKPIKEEELKNAIYRFEQASDEISFKGKIENLLHNINSEKEAFQLIIPLRQGEKKLQIKNIVRCEADSNYTHFFLNDKTKFTASKTLKECEEMLSQKEFLRVHKSHLINKKFIQLLKNDNHVVLTDGSLIEVSRRKLQEVKNSILK
ncbi:MAG: response regulator [Bacteroidetes bacterium]|nr:response regulator [Bacteroidota bacterium]